MKFKNLTMLIAAGVMAISMVGCNSDSAGNETTANEPETQTEASSENNEVSEVKLTNTEGKLVWATNAEFPPYEYRENGEIIGIDAEMADYIGEKLGLEVEVEDMNFDSIVAAVQSGKADLGIAGMTIDEDRLQSVNFSTPYVNAGQVIIVKNDSPIAASADLKDKTIGVQLGTTGDLYVSENVEGVSVERYNKGFEAVQALMQGKLDAVVIDGEPAKAFVSANNDIKILEEQLTEEEYAIAVNKDNEALLNAVNEVLAEMQENGKMAEITDKYLNN